MPPPNGKKQDSRGRYYSYGPDCKHSTGRSRKRKKVFHRKLKSEASESIENVQNESTSSYSDTTNRIIDISILFRELENSVCCNECHGPVHISESNTQGLGFQIDVKCEKCDYVAAIDSCKKVGQMNNAWETNSRSVFAMRILGHGHADLSSLCGIMDLPAPVEQSTFTAINDHLSKVCEEADQDSENVVVKEEKLHSSSPPTSEMFDVFEEKCEVFDVIEEKCEVFDVFEEKCEVIENIPLKNNDDYDPQ